MATLRLHLEDVYGEDIRHTYRHFVLSFHDKAQITAEASEAAAAQGKFWEMHDLIFERQQEWNGLSPEEMPEVLTEYAEELGLDTERFAQELEDRTYKAKVDADTQTAAQANLRGTPSYVVNGVVYEMDLSLPLIESFIELVVYPPEPYEELPPQVIDEDKDYRATFRTSAGDIVFELYPELAPVNVNNFVFLAQEEWYDGQTFFFVEPGRRAHSGDPLNMGYSLPFTGYVCSNEITPELTFNEEGMLALFAPQGANSSHLFITLTPWPDLNGQFTIIGRIVEGMDVANSLQETQPGYGQPADVIETIEIEEG